VKKVTTYDHEMAIKPVPRPRVVTLKFEIDYSTNDCKNLHYQSKPLPKYLAVATRYDKLARNDESIVALAFSIMWIPMWID
jgi:hypothetical protein